MNRPLYYSVVITAFLLAAQVSASAQQGGGGGQSGGGGGSLIGLKYILMPKKDKVTKNKFALRIANLSRSLFWGARISDSSYNVQNLQAYNNVIRNIYDSILLYPTLTAFFAIDLKNYHDTARMAIFPDTKDTIDKSRLVTFKDLGFTFDDTTKHITNPPISISYRYGVKNLYYTVPRLPEKDSSHCCCPQPAGEKLDSIDMAYQLMTDDLAFFRHKLKVFVTSVNQTTDTLTVKLWYRKRIARKITHIDNLEDIYQMDFKLPLDYFSGHAWRKFIIPFRTRYLIPVNLPIVRDFNYGRDSSQAWQTNFLNAGMAYGWAWGRTKFFKYNQLPPRNEYAGAGFLFNLQAASSSPSGQGSKAPAPFAKILFGVHVGFGFGSLQLIAGSGYYYNISSTTGFQLQPKPWFGAGIGLSMFNFAVPSFSGGGGSGH